MKALIVLLQRHGFQHIKTYIQSGNIVLHANAISSDELAALIAAEFGFRPDVLILDKTEFETAVKLNPFHPAEGKSAHFYFCSKEPSLNAEKREKYLADAEAYELIGKVFYLHAPNGIGRSKRVAHIESCLGVSATGRNLNTINKRGERVQNT